MGESSKSPDEAPGPNPDRGRRRIRALPGCLVALATLLIGFVGVPYALLALAFWAADGSWDFEGDKNFRYWFFVSGKRAEKLGVVAPADKPVRYSVRGSDGNFPGWAVVQYESNAAPAEIIEAYASRCEGLKAKVTGRKAPEQKDDTIGLHLECEFEGYLTAEFYAERASSSQPSNVSLRIWGME